MRFAAFLSAVLPAWSDLHLQDISLAEQELLLTFSSAGRTARCPDCQQHSRDVHSRYTRLLSDLPLGGVPVRVQVHARRFRCLTPACARQTFRERLEAGAPRYQRRTPGLRKQLETIGLALGGQAGHRLARVLALGATGASRNTLLRLVRCAPLPTVEELAPELHIVGVDDFAFRRGTRYGSILVDLEQHRVIDLLPDREADTLATWLEQHQGTQLQVVSRDRGGAYAEGARRGAPHAQQVADRFHLLQNLGQALDRLLTREHRLLTRVADGVREAILADAIQTEQAEGCPNQSAGGAESATNRDHLPPEEPAVSPPAALLTRVEREQVAVEERRRARFERVMAVATEGHALREVARRTGVSRETVRAYLAAGVYRPCATKARTVHRCDAYAGYLRQRWNAGAHNSATLYQEIRAQGYTGAKSTVRQYVQGWRTGPRRAGRRREADEASGDGGVAPPRSRRFSPRQTRWILVRPFEELDAPERAYRQALCQESVTVATAQALAADFGRLVRTRAHDDLARWRQAALSSHIPELVSFARGLQRDADAVAAALRLPYSQGQVEGQVNRLKMLKRQTYGRANFDLLRRRVLSHTA